MKILFYACLLITPLLFAKDSQDISNPLNNIFNYYEYTDYFSTHSKHLKDHAKWVCEECGADKSKDPGNLHTHHINGIKTDNKPSNLIVLCYDCHSKKPGHGTLRKR